MIKTVRASKKTHNTYHGFSRTRLYRIYAQILTRCLQPNSKDYKKYGAKGIGVSKEWLGDNGFLNFREWSLGHGYEDNLTIDRINNNGNYAPDNCRWTTNKVQMNNTSQNRFLYLNGEKHTIAEWSRITGICEETIHARIKLGWNDEDVLTRPLQVQRKPTPEMCNIYRDKKKYAVHINNKYIGSYATIEEAQRARDAVKGGKHDI